MTPEHDEKDLKLVVAGRIVQSDGVVSMTLRDADGHDLPRWRAGAHVDIWATPGTVRQYSLCGSPGDPREWRIAVLRGPQSRGGSNALHDHAPVGTVLSARGPRNHFALPAADRYLFIAGGIGITPILAMMREASSEGVPFELHYGGRTRSGLAFVDEIVAQYAANAVVLVPEDELGLLPLQTILDAVEPGTVVLACGPEGLLAAVEAACKHRNLRVVTERFTPKPQVPSVSGAFEVELAARGQTVVVGEDESILDALTRSGLDVPSSCQEGTCGTCETAVLSGTPEHRDSILTDEEQEAGDCMMICVSRSRTPRLVLDL